MANRYDLLIIGGGPAGYAAAERAGKAGLSVCLFEKRAMGGVCLNEGCIPSKSLLNSAKIYEHAKNGREFGVIAGEIALDHALVMRRKEKTVRKLVAGVKLKMKSAGVAVIEGEAAILNKNGEGFLVGCMGEEYLGRRLLIATGSEPSIPPIDGLYQAVESGFALTNREILSLIDIPKRLAIIGGGVIGLEMASYFAVAGSDVTVIEMLDHIAGPTEGEISAMLLSELKKQGIRFMLGAKVTAVKEGVIESDKGSAEADRALISIGRRPVIKGFGLESIGVFTERGAIVTDERGRTNVPDCWAAGDVNGKSMLAHTAYREAEVCVSDMLGRPDNMSYDAIPAVIYTQPEVAGVGHTLETALQDGYSAREIKLPMAYSGRFVAENSGEGLCKVIYDERTGYMLGVHMLGSYSSEIIYGAAAFIENKSRLCDVARVVFPHPTVSEIIKEAIQMAE